MKVDLSEVNVIEISGHAGHVRLGKVPPGKKAWEMEVVAVFEYVEGGEHHGNTLGLSIYHVKLDESE